MSANGGYGRFWGPNVDLNGNDTLGEGKIAGKEYLAFADDGSGTQERQPARADSGELQPGPAVHRHGDVVRIARRVRRDLGGGRVGPEARLRGRLHRQGQRQRRARTRDQSRHADRRHARRRERRRQGSIFTANLGATSLSTFNTSFPNRYAFKHAHSQQNPEKDWGKNTLQAIQFAYWALNDSYGTLDGIDAHRSATTRAASRRSRHR